MISRPGWLRMWLPACVGVTVGLGAASAHGAGPAQAPSSLGEPIRVSADIGGGHAVVEVRDLPTEAATRAVEEALRVIADAERQLSNEDAESPISRLNQTAGTGPQAVGGDLGRMLQTALGFCLWSRGAFGPLGGVLYRTWESAERPPARGSLEPGVRSASCQNLTLDPEALTAALTPGSLLDLRHFAAGWGVDRAVHALQQAGVANAWVEFRSAMRAIGSGPAGRGWEVALPMLPGMTEPLDSIWLRDQALAVISTHRNRFRFGDSSFPPFIDQRSGAPATGTVGVMVDSHLALDAQAIGSAMVILGNREGQLRLSGVVPPPSVLWLLGEGDGEPLLATYRWSELRSN